MRNGQSSSIPLNEKAESTRHNIPIHVHLNRRALKLFGETSAEQPDGILSLDVVGDGLGA